MSHRAPALAKPRPGSILVPAGLLLVIAASAAWLRIDAASVFSKETLEALGVTAGRLIPPRADADTLMKAGRGVIETLAISVAGTVLGAGIGLLLAPFCSASLFRIGDKDEAARAGAARRGGAFLLHMAARLVANILRTVPYFVWAILFWFMVGLGPFLGALAIAVHTGGVFGRLYAAALDAVPARPLEALRGLGAGRLQILLFGTLPSARSALASYTLYRWEVNIRESAVLGLVGAGGLGFRISYALGTFDWPALGTYILAVLALVLAVDAVSARVRRALL